MAPTNIVADELERFGVRTFSAMEMAFNTLGLMHPLLFSITQVELSGHGPLVRPCRYHSTDLLTSCLVLTSASNSRPSNLANLCKTFVRGLIDPVFDDPARPEILEVVPQHLTAEVFTWRAYNIYNTPIRAVVVMVLWEGLSMSRRLESHQSMT